MLLEDFIIKNSFYVKKVYILAVILVFCLSAYAGASTVSFLVVETGVSENQRIYQHSIIWENALLDVFFEAGYIVSNDQLLQLEKLPQGDIFQLVDLDEVRNGGVDYMIIAALEYFGEVQLPKDISLYVYRVNPVERIHQNTVSQRPRNDLNEVKSITRGLVNYVR